MAKQKFTVIHPVEHDGVRFVAEETIELEEVHAKPLLDVGAIIQEKKEGSPNASEIISSIPGLGDDALNDLFVAERTGKDRKTVMEAIEAEIKKRSEQEWEANADLREQHGNDFNAYLAAVLGQLS